MMQLLQGLHHLHYFHLHIYSSPPKILFLRPKERTDATVSQTISLYLQLGDLHMSSKAELEQLS